MMDFKIRCWKEARQKKYTRFPFIQNPSAGPLNHGDSTHEGERGEQKWGRIVKGTRIEPGRALRSLRQEDNDL